MAAVQTSYSETMRAGLPGLIANAELDNIITRTLSTGALAFGQPVQQVTGHKCAAADELTMTPTGANGVPAPAGATIGSITSAPPAKAGVYTITCTVGGSTTTSRWVVRDPDGNYVGTAIGNTAFSAQGIGFTVTDTGTDPVAGEAFTITVAAEADGRFLGLSVRDPSLDAIATIDTYKQYDNVAIMTKGVMWVTCGDTVTEGAQVYWDEADSRYTVQNTDYIIPGAVFEMAGVDGDIVKIAIR